MLQKFTIDSIETKIKKYMSLGNLNRSLLVNVNNLQDYQDLYTILGRYTVINRISSYCHESDYTPNIEEFYATLPTLQLDNSIVGFTQYLQLLGDNAIVKGISTVLGITVQGKIIVLCYQMERVLESMYCQDLRFERQICLVDGTKSNRTHLVFIGTEGGGLETTSEGIKSAIEELENGLVERIIVKTRRKKLDFMESLLPIQEITNVFDTFTLLKYRFSNSLSKENGTNEQWSELLELLNQYKSLDNVLIEKLGNNTMFEALYIKWDSFNSFQKWLFFIGVKIYGVKASPTLERSAMKAITITDFVKNLYSDILDYQITDKDFCVIYLERKNLLKSHKAEINRIREYCNLVEIKEKNAIYYLTDNSEPERIKIIECLSKYDYKKEEIKSILQRVYPALAAYLKEYYFNIPLLDGYFQDYKLQKVTNRIYDYFIEKVNQNAMNREYLAVLPYRSERIEAIDKQDSLLYFVDALGVEFLGYIMEKCKELGLSAKVTICHCKLPSITSLNKEFLDEFEETKIVSVKELDEILHHGKEDFDYQKQKFPIHLIRELEIIDEFLQKICGKIISSECKKAIIVSDHGASRLAVISENVYNFDVDSKGEKGGRCCAYTEQLPHIPYAVKENNYYVLASYDRFKGGRAANIETHGGATLEEVVVPIIELQKKIEVEVLFAYKNIKVSNRKKAELQVYTNIVLSDITIKVNEKFYLGIKTEDKRFVIEMPDIKKAGAYVAEIYSNNNLIASEMEFIVEKEGFSETDFF